MGINPNKLSDQERAAARAIDRDDTPLQSGGDKRLRNYTKRFDKKNQSWLERWGRYYRPAKILSLVCNVASGAGVFYMVALALNGLPGAYTNYVVAALCLFGFEWMKREASDSFWDDYWANKRTIDWGRLSINAFLFLLSITASLYGVQQLVRNTDAGKIAAAQKYEQRVADMKGRVDGKAAEIAAVQAGIKARRADRSNYNRAGKFLYTKQTDETTDKKRIAKLETALMAQEEKLIALEEAGPPTVTDAADGPKSAADWQDELMLKIGFTLLACLLLEFLFEVCMGFLSRFDFKMMNLMLKTQGRGSRTTNGSHVPAMVP